MTHTKDEAMKLALEALETELAVDMTNGAEVGEAAELMCEAITAIKAALEAKDKTVEQPKVRTGDCLLVGVCASEGHKIQPQRTWVGLTDEEAQQTFAKHNCTISTHLAGILARAIEAKLKEKNT
jgi:hypothetical protein